MVFEVPFLIGKWLKSHPVCTAAVVLSQQAGALQPTWGMPIECLTLVTTTGGGIVFLGHMEQLLHKTTAQNWERQLFYLIHIDKHTETSKWGDRGISFKSKKKANSPQKELNEIKISNLADEELKVTVINMLSGLKRINEYSKNFNKELQNLKKIISQNWTE